MLPRQPQKNDSETIQICIRIPVTLFSDMAEAMNTYDCTRTELVIDALKYYFEQGQLNE